MKRVVVGLSGGVDSSMSLVLLKKRGFSPVGVSLMLPVWKNGRIASNASDIRFAKTVCEKLNVPHHVIDARSEFLRDVVDYFVSGLKKNRTPNPCVICNRFLKFRKFFEFAKKEGIRYVATGHYARIRKNRKTGRCELLMAKNEYKDQSYGLCMLPGKWLGHMILPLGNYKKEEVYEMAKKFGFGFFSEKEESNDFCFASGKALQRFLEERIGVKKGRVVDPSGNVLGEHNGFHFYTIGQRKGFSISGKAVSGGRRYYVKDFDEDKNDLIVTDNLEDIYKRDVFLYPFNFINDPIESKARATVKLQVRERIKATVFPPEGKQLRVRFERPTKIVGKGQFCVIYDRSVCLGGGEIDGYN